MGCDIHGVFQRRDGSEWVDIATLWDEERHYQLFAVLAGVRNGYGFAGVPTGERVKPISSPRGLPKDFAYEFYEHPLPMECLPPHRRRWWEQDHPLEVRSMAPDVITMLSGYRYDDEPITLHECAMWMGDHSFSWLMGSEMVNWYAEAPTVVKIGVISKRQFETWDKVTPPQWYCGDVWGGEALTISEAEVGKVDVPWTDVRVTWEQDLKKELAYFFKEVQSMMAMYGEIRFVFGFDS